MNSTTKRRLTLPAVALASALALAACGGDDGSDTAAAESSSSQDGSTSGDSADEAQGNDADVSFLTGMKPHHEQAVEMSDIVLAANPPAEVAAIATRIKAAQSPEIEQIDQMLEALGEETEAEHGGAHSEGHGGMMSEQDMAQLRAATGTEAARLYLERMIAHHQGAIDAADDEIANGEYEPAVKLAREIKTAQAEEITEMQSMLAAL